MPLTIGDLIAVLNDLRSYDEKRKLYHAALLHLNTASNEMRDAIRSLQKPGIAKHIVLPPDLEALAAELMPED